MTMHPDVKPSVTVETRDADDVLRGSETEKALLLLPREWRQFAYLVANQHERELRSAPDYQYRARPAAAYVAAIESVIAQYWTAKSVATDIWGDCSDLSHTARAE